MRIGVQADVKQFTTYIIADCLRMIAVELANGKVPIGPVWFDRLRGDSAGFQRGTGLEPKLALLWTVVVDDAVRISRLYFDLGNTVHTPRQYVRRGPPTVLELERPGLIERFTLEIQQTFLADLEMQCRMPS